MGARRPAWTAHQRAKASGEPCSASQSGTAFCSTESPNQSRKRANRSQASCSWPSLRSVASGTGQSFSQLKAAGLCLALPWRCGQSNAMLRKWSRAVSSLRKTNASSLCAAVVSGFAARSARRAARRWAADRQPWVPIHPRSTEVPCWPRNRRPKRPPPSTGRCPTTLWG